MLLPAAALAKESLYLGRFTFYMYFSSPSSSPHHWRAERRGLRWLSLCLYSGYHNRRVTSPQQVSLSFLQILRTWQIQTMLFNHDYCGLGMDERHPRRVLSSGSKFRALQCALTTFVLFQLQEVCPSSSSSSADICNAVCQRFDWRCGICYSPNEARPCRYREQRWI